MPVDAKFKYSYCPGHTAKWFPGHVIFKGRPTGDQLERLKKVVNYGQGGHFKPDVVGIPSLDFSSATGRRCNSHVFDGVDLTCEEPTDPRTFETFVHDMERAAVQKWEPATTDDEKIARAHAIDKKINRVVDRLLAEQDKLLAGMGKEAIASGDYDKVRELEKKLPPQSWERMQLLTYLCDVAQVDAKGEALSGPAS
jgi:hypothetical protein